MRNYSETKGRQSGGWAAFVLLALIVLAAAVFFLNPAPTNQQAATQPTAQLTATPTAATSPSVLPQQAPAPEPTVAEEPVKLDLVANYSQFFRDFPLSRSGLVEAKTKLLTLRAWLSSQGDSQTPAEAFQKFVLANENFLAAEDLLAGNTNFSCANKGVYEKALAELSNSSAALGGAVTLLSAYNAAGGGLVTASLEKEWRSAAKGLDNGISEQRERVAACG